MDKWDYINLISAMSNFYGDKLVDMMEYYKKNNLREITYEEAKEYYEEIKENDL